MWSSIHKRSVHIQTYHLPTSNANPHRNNAYLSPKSTRTIRIPYNIISVYLYLICNPFISCSHCYLFPLTILFICSSFCSIHFVLGANLFVFSWHFLNCGHCYISAMHTSKSIHLVHFSIFTSFLFHDTFYLSHSTVTEMLIAISIFINTNLWWLSPIFVVTSEQCARRS